MTLYDDIIVLLKHRMVSNTDKLAPLYVCGIGCHIFNIINKDRKIFTEGTLVSDVRLHVVMVTVPGFGKSFILKQFLDDDAGICSKTKIKPKWAASMTTASFIGTIKSDKEGNPVITKGMCQKYKTSILGVHEFAEITTSMALSYNTGLNDALLLVLDDGKVRKDIASGEISYQTMLTLYSAVQPARYNLSSGLGRRICFLVYIPSYGDISTLREIRRKSRYIKDNTELLNSIRARIDKKYEDVTKIEKVIFSERFYAWMTDNNIIPFEEILYERIGIGYTIMNTDDIKETLFVDIDERLGIIMEAQKLDRRSIKQGIDLEQVWRIIKGEKKIEKDRLIDTLLEFSLSRRDISSRLKTLTVMDLIKEENGYYYIKGKQ